MTQDERRIYLIKELLKEDERLGEIEIPADRRGQRDLLRALTNIRPPRPISEEFLRVQDEYLARERDRAGVVDAGRLPALRRDGRLVLWQGDITTLKVDAIVNAANSALRGCFYPLHSCIDNIIHTKSGIQLRLFCDDIMNRQNHDEPPGRAKITPAFNLPSGHIIHTVGPVVGREVLEKDRYLLSSCYRSCLSLAAESGCESIAFCCISTGEFHFPNEEAAKIAVSAAEDFLRTDERIKRVVFDVFKDEDLQIYRELLGDDEC